MASPNLIHPDRHPNIASDLHSPASHQPQPSHQHQPPEATSSPGLTSHTPEPAPLHLPTSRQFLTSLITAISNIPLLDSEPPTQICKLASAEAPAAEAGEAGENTSKETKRKQLLQVLKDEGEAQGDTTSKAKTKKPGEQVNPLKLVPPEYRHLIITLHVLFPGVVLPALEVLERGLVERIILRSFDPPREKVKEEEKSTSKGQKEEDVDVIMGEEDPGDNNDEHEQQHQDRGNQEDKSDDKPKKQDRSDRRAQRRDGLQEKRWPTPEFYVYLVRSSQFLNNTHFKRKRKKPSNIGLGDAADTEGGPGSEPEQDRIQRYLVSLEVWNCTCAAFAFACISELDSTSDIAGMGREAGGRAPEEEAKGARKGEDAGEDAERERDKVGSAGWTFGGMTLFDLEDQSSVPPVCKHLLACLLADKWRGALGRYVMDRVVSREEMAGVVADV